MRRIQLLLLLPLGLWLRPAPQPPDRPTAPSPGALDSARHVLDRLTYGPRPGMAEAVAREGVMRWIERQLASDEVDDPGLESTLRGFDLLSTPSDQLLRQFLELRQERAQRQRQSAEPPSRPAAQGSEFRRLLGQLPQVVVVRAVGSERQLGEIMADFWFNHFNIFVGKNLARVYLPEYVEETIRAHALGRFEDLLIATARSPAMMVYLDNTQSVAPGATPPNPPARPGFRMRQPPLDPAMDSLRRQAEQRRPTGLNENYARELLELHTLGVNGGYTQQDVTEVARILTGWGIAPVRGAVARRMGRGGGAGSGFGFTGWAHDRGAKTVLGTEFPAGQGEDEGMRLLRMLAAHPSTQHYVSGKLCARFVNDLPPDGCIDDAVRAWRRSNGDLREVLRAIFRSPDFWAPTNRGAKVKTPLEFVVSAVRAVGGGPDTTPRLALAVARLGQPLYQHVAPNGYGERQEDWVNSGALLNRMNFALGLAANRQPGITVNLDGVAPVSADPNTLVQSINRAILAGRMSTQTRQVILEQLAGVSDPAAARALAVGLAIGGPEFQRQ
ncbi:MAG: DUF1800 domain-containing protein [Gemmatimonadales bacterium]